MNSNNSVKNANIFNCFPYISFFNGAKYEKIKSTTYTKIYKDIRVIVVDNKIESFEFSKIVPNINNPKIG